MRTFQILTAAGWVAVPAHHVSNGDVFRVLDGGVPVALAPEAAPDPGVYVAVQTAREGVHFCVRLPDGRVLDKVASFGA